MAVKIFDIEVLEDDMVYVGNDIRAKDKETALKILTLMSGGIINEDSEILSCEEKTVH
jgi:hypothetical protein|tara:strand:+ start:409 stop:582 length:174 start_codon:yes stop_codon:yes gene_type:complete